MTSERECNNGGLRPYQREPIEVPQVEVSALSGSLEEQHLADNGDLEDYYKADERNIARFAGLHYLAEKKQWVARFLPAPGIKSRLSHSDGTHSQVLRLARLLHGALVKPSQCYIALAQFDNALDREAAKLRPSRPAGPLPPAP